jgi:hypothetical protein
MANGTNWPLWILLGLTCLFGAATLGMVAFLVDQSGNCPDLVCPDPCTEPLTLTSENSQTLDALTTLLIDLNAECIDDCQQAFCRGPHNCNNLPEGVLCPCAGVQFNPTAYALCIRDCSCPIL